MSAVAITRRLEFDAGHRVLGHEGMCACIHGHRYVAEITVTAPALDQIDRVIDFGVIKKRVGEWINWRWDHNLLLNDQDPLWQLPNLVELNNGKVPFIFKGENPTAEVIAKHLFGICESLLPELDVVSVRIYETPNCWADYPIRLPRSA